MPAPVFGLNLYTWAALTFLVAVLTAAAHLVLTREFPPLGAAQTSSALRRTAGFTPTVLVLRRKRGRGA
ncbi:hypothetical protein WDV06_23125 [Streptomyces racemochromogenes]|uniref:Uncharacterized protein n=1 Tax=Streptomyces racemochromogenes TaxID=67353 RepID=A0ABW7PI50_9ACTN